MKSNFITIRLDRMKYFDLQLLYKDIQGILGQYDADGLHLSVPFARFNEKSVLLTALDEKDRFKHDREWLRKYYKRLDDLVSAFLLNLKALKRADFAEYRFGVDELNKLARKDLGNFVHVGAVNKNDALNSFFWNIGPYEENGWLKSVEKLGLIQYLKEIQAVRANIDTLNDAEKKMKKGQVKSDEAIKAKADIIQEIRILLQFTDVTVMSHPEVDYTGLINIINYYLKSHRAQLRNLQTRRARKKERETNLPNQTEEVVQKSSFSSDNPESSDK